jgi:hypothetical protein
LKQVRKTAEEYINEFTQLLQKVDSTNTWTNNMKVWKFIEGLNPKISLLIYMQNLNGLDEAFDLIIRASISFDMGRKNELETSLAEQVEAL